MRHKICGFSDTTLVNRRRTFFFRFTHTKPYLGTFCYGWRFRFVYQSLEYYLLLFQIFFNRRNGLTSTAFAGRSHRRQKYFISLAVRIVLICQFCIICYCITSAEIDCHMLAEACDSINIRKCSQQFAVCILVAVTLTRLQGALFEMPDEWRHLVGCRYSPVTW